MIKELFGSHPAKPIAYFSCGHLIPPANCFVATLSKGPTLTPLKFTFETKSALSVMNELGQILSNFCIIVPDGIVVFFPSFSYLETVLDHWGKSGLLKQIENKRPVFVENQSRAPHLLEHYAEAVNLGKGAILFAVMGGKLSEGINFSD